MSDLRPIQVDSPKQDDITVVTLETPLTDEDISGLKAGMIVSLSGVIYTARDAAHRLLVTALDQGENLPFDPKGQAIYYVGPSPTKPGGVIGSCGPTTSYRMDPYTPQMLNAGIKAMIGKGPRGPQVVEAIKSENAVYLAMVGGAAALLSRSVRSCVVVAYPELGTEAIHRLEVENFTCVVAIDNQGNNLYETGPAEFRVTEDATDEVDAEQQE